jgi:DNA-binding transcriptional LysR family regulator
MIRFLAPLIAEFLTLYPTVSVDLETGERMIDLVEENIDLAIRPVPLPDSTLVVRKLTPWRHILCCSPSYLQLHPEPRLPSDLAQHNCIQYALYPYGNEWRFEGPDGSRQVRVSLRSRHRRNGGDEGFSSWRL